MIELVDFTKSYSENKNVVESVSFKAEKGSITGLLGLNGAGKTTIIKAICGVHYGTSGSVKVSDDDGNIFTPETDIAGLKRSIGYVPEQNSLPLKFTVKEYLYFIYNMFETDGKRDFEKSFRHTVQLCALEDVVSKQIGTLSKGFRQRVSFAQALIHNPANIILDEPVNGLDPAQIIQFRKMIKNVSKDKTVLISTHLMQEVEALCTNIHIISGGKLAASGTIDSVVAQTGSKHIEDAFLKITGGAQNE